MSFAAQMSELTSKEAMAAPGSAEEFFFLKLLGLTQKLSLRTRLTTLYVVIFGATLTAFSILMFRFMASSLERSFDDTLYNYAVDVFESVSLDPSGDLSFKAHLFDREKIYPFSLGTALIQIRHRSGKILSQIGDFGNLQLPYKHELSLIAQGEDVAYRTVTKLEGLPNIEAESYRMITVPVDNSPSPQLLLQIAVPLTVLESQLDARRLWLEVSVPLALLLATLAGYFMSGRALRPIQLMIEEARGLEASNLSARLPVPRVKDELQQLARTMNEMLERIEASFISQERFVADASHQLLTPLTIMKSELEAAAKSSSDEQRSVWKSLLQEVDELTHLVRGLLVLARVEAGKDSLSLEPLYLDEVLVDVLGDLRKLAETRKIGIQFHIDNLSSNEDFHPQVLGERDLLRNLLMNIIENAIKYSPDSGVVKVTLQWSENQTLTLIEDQGPGIPKEQIQFIFDRFSRGAGIRTRGFGLGLAIAHSIAKAHRAKLECLPKNPPGSLFRLEMKNI